MNPSNLIDAKRLQELLPFPELIDALEQAFRSPCHSPQRQSHDIGGLGTLLIMPAWTDGESLGVKIVQVFPGNGALGKPAVNGMYVLCSARTGELEALFDAEELTTRRTAAASALASRYLSRSDSRCHLILGSGRLAFDVIAAHATVRPIARVLIWSRRSEPAAALARRVNEELGLHALPVSDVAAALTEADIVSTVTTTQEPILPGRFVRPGTHLDLIGGFTPKMREADDEAVRRARLYVDMRAAALREAGDITDPLARGVIKADQLLGDLFELSDGRAVGRVAEQDVTLFKSVGLALEDLAAARLAYKSFSRR
jgi:ornithine cyclodeaminase